MPKMADLASFLLTWGKGGQSLWWGNAPPPFMLPLNKEKKEKHCIIMVYLMISSGFQALRFLFMNVKD